MIGEKPNYCITQFILHDGAEVELSKKVSFDGNLLVALNMLDKALYEQGIDGEVNLRFRMRYGNQD